MKTPLTTDLLKIKAAEFGKYLSAKPIPELYGVNDGKRVGTYVEHALISYLKENHEFEQGSSASGIDFPGLSVDIKVTSVVQPQSSSPFRDASQKVYGLGYHLLVFVYDKKDDSVTRSTLMSFLNILFISRERTADYQTTFGLLRLLSQHAGPEDISAYLEERNLPLDEIGRSRLTEEIFNNPPLQGYLTVSNALQWRLQYQRAITYSLLPEKERPEGIDNLSS